MLVTVVKYPTEHLERSAFAFLEFIPEEALQSRSEVVLFLPSPHLSLLRESKINNFFFAYSLCYTIIQESTEATALLIVTVLGVTAGAETGVGIYKDKKTTTTQQTKPFTIH